MNFRMGPKVSKDDRKAPWSRPQTRNPLLNRKVIHMERFLRYSYEKQRPIRLMLMISGSLKQVTATVTQRTDEAITLDCRRPKKTLTLRPEDILAADYIKKDEGLEP